MGITRRWITSCRLHTPLDNLYNLSNTAMHLVDITSKNGDYLKGNHSKDHRRLPMVFKSITQETSQSQESSPHEGHFGEGGRGEEERGKILLNHFKYHHRLAAPRVPHESKRYKMIKCLPAIVKPHEGTWGTTWKKSPHERAGEKLRAFHLAGKNPKSHKILTDFFFL